MVKTEYSGKAYTWSLVTYASIRDLNKLLSYSKHWAYCFHDKDINEETGELKVPHFHVICTFDNQVSLEHIRALLESGQNTLGECRRKCGSNWIPLNVSSLYAYLIHQGYEDKYQYDETERVVDSTHYWQRFDQYKKPSGDNEFITDLLGAYHTRGEFLLEMGKKYGRDFIKNYKSYEDYRNNLMVYTLSETEGDENENLCS